MAANRGPSLSDMMAADLGQDQAKKARRAAPAKVAPEAKVVPLNPPAGADTPAAPATAQPPEKVTLYLPREVYRFIKQTALELEKRPHDLLMEGVDLMLAQHGKSVKSFQK